ncbi:ABC-2 type transport system ATP-binding protein [Raineyella antarctica]|uniref:ABC-2 type transport system ATP-binding protein n=1 Tax=Raineyella antarctica TaxID=1577474 RepID=A0A1G6GQ70_9ACTN|nr:ABC transporter ATP-binding protein [Raineyella antarctica]SDB83963.1 ABC-2 type transport system ATP-binding protein [Raineyella antarctica]
MLQISHLTHRFGSKVAVDDLTLAVPAGSITGFIGHNGAGKSTTLRSVAGILPFTAGTVTVEGHDVRADPIAAKKVMAFLPDSPDLYDFMTGQDFLGFVADLFRIPGPERRARIARYAQAYGLEEELGDVIGSYSHGMKQKLALISAFMRRPRLLLLDEPFVGLDPVAAHTLKGHLRRLCDDGGSVLFSTHVLEVAQALCDDLAIIRRGRLVVSGPTAQVTGDSSLEEVFLELQESAR